MPDNITVNINTPNIMGDIGRNNPIIFPSATSYEELIDKPQINDVTLTGNKSFDDLGLSRISADELLNMLRGIFN